MKPLKFTLALITICYASNYLFNLYHDWSLYQQALQEVPKVISINAGPASVQVDDNTTWDTVIKAIVSILATALGLKLISKIK